MRNLDKKTKDFLISLVKRIKKLDFHDLNMTSNEKGVVTVSFELEPEMEKNISLALIYNELKSFKNEFKEFKSEITKDVSILKSDVTSLKSDVTSLKSDVTTLKSDVALILKCPTIKKEISELKNNKK